MRHGPLFEQLADGAHHQPASVRAAVQHGLGGVDQQVAHHCCRATRLAITSPTSRTLGSTTTAIACACAGQHSSRVAHQVFHVHRLQHPDSPAVAFLIGQDLLYVPDLVGDGATVPGPGSPGWRVRRRPVPRSAARSSLRSAGVAASASSPRARSISAAGRGAQSSSRLASFTPSGVMALPILVQHPSGHFGDTVLIGLVDQPAARLGQSSVIWSNSRASMPSSSLRFRSSRPRKSPSVPSRIA